MIKPTTSQQMCTIKNENAEFIRKIKIHQLANDYSIPFGQLGLVI